MERERDYQYGETRKGDQPRGLKYVSLSGGYQSAEFRCQGSSAEPQEAKPSKSQDYAAKIQRRLNKHRIDCIRNYVSKNYPESSDSQASQSINVETFFLGEYQAAKYSSVPWPSYNDYGDD